MAISYVLEQKDQNDVYQPIAFGGRKLSKSDAKLSSYDGETLAGYHAFVSLSRYLRAASLTGLPNVWRKNNRPIEYAQKRKDIYGRLARIIMFLGWKVAQLDIGCANCHKRKFFKALPFLQYELHRRRSYAIRLVLSNHF